MSLRGLRSTWDDALARKRGEIQDPDAAAGQSKNFMEAAWGGQQPWDSGKGGGIAGKSCKGKGGAPGSFDALFQSVKSAGILGGGKVPEECQIFFKNLPTDTTDADLCRLCCPFGAIPPNGAKAMLNPDGSCKGIGFVDFSDSLAASNAVTSLDGHTTADGTVIRVSAKKPATGGSIDSLVGIDSLAAF